MAVPNRMGLVYKEKNGIQNFEGFWIIWSCI